MSTRTVRRGRLDVANQTVTLSGATYEVAVLPEPSRRYLETLGLKAALLGDANVAEAYAGLRAGRVPAGKPISAPRRAKWREALAAALAHTAAQRQAPKGTKRHVLEAQAASLLDSMKAHVAALPAETVATLRQRADVQEHYHRLFGTREQDGQTSLLALAGVEPWLDLPEEPMAAEPAGVAA